MLLMLFELLFVQNKQDKENITFVLGNVWLSFYRLYDCVIYQKIYINNHYLQPSVLYTFITEAQS